MDPRRASRAAAPRAAADLGEHLGALRIVGDPGDRRAGEQQMGASASQYSANARSTPTGSLSRSQREIWVISGRVGRDRPVLDQARRGAPTRALAPVEAVEERAAEVIRLLHAGRPGSAATASGSRSWFFGENASIDGGTIQTRSSSRPSQTNALAGEDVCVRVADVGPQEFPGLVRASSPGRSTPMWQRQIDLDVGGDDVRHEPGRLRVVDVDDVPGPNELDQLVGGLGQRGVVDLALRRPQAPTVAGRTRAGGCGSAS